MTPVTVEPSADLNSHRPAATLLYVTASRPAPLDWALFCFCVATWGSAYAAVHVGLDFGAWPWLVVAGRLWLAAILLNIILWVRRALKQEPPPTPGQQGKLALMGVLGACAPFALFAYAQLEAPSGLVGLYSAVTPILVAGLAPFIAPEDRLTPAKAAGVLLGFAGVAVLMGPAALEGLGSASLLAQAAAALGAVCYAGNTLVARAGRPIPALESAASWTFYGALIATPFAFWTAPAAGAIQWQAYAAIGFLALFPTALASIAYFYLIRSTGVVFVTQTNYLLPLWALALGAIALREPLGMGAIAAFLLIVAGLFIAQEGWRYLRLRPAA